MADYYPLIAKAVEGLQNVSDRRRLYERGRSALVAELEAFTPPLSQTVITKELLAFEEAIREVEAELAYSNSDEPAD
ncbi:MAG: hypothetical protein R3D52_04535 [Xanthobacteraceae bacterium]